MQPKKRIRLLPLLAGALVLANFCTQSAAAEESAELKAARDRVTQITTDPSSMQEYSDSHIIMYKHLYGENADLSNFKYLDGIANKKKAALLYQVNDSSFKKPTTYLIRLRFLNQWEVFSLSTYSEKKFKQEGASLVNKPGLE